MFFTVFLAGFPSRESFMIAVPISDFPQSPAHGIQISTHQRNLMVWQLGYKILLSGWVVSKHLLDKYSLLVPQWKLNLYVLNWPKICSCFAQFFGGHIVGQKKTFWAMKQGVSRSFSLPLLHASLKHAILLLWRYPQLLLSREQSMGNTAFSPSSFLTVSILSPLKMSRWLDASFKKALLAILSSCPLHSPEYTSLPVEVK